MMGTIVKLKVRQMSSSMARSTKKRSLKTKNLPNANKQRNQNDKGKKIKQMTKKAECFGLQKRWTDS